MENKSRTALQDAAARLGRRGGEARAAKLDERRRKEIARMGGLASAKNGKRRTKKVGA